MSFKDLLMIDYKLDQKEKRFPVHSAEEWAEILAEGDYDSSMIMGIVSQRDRIDTELSAARSEYETSALENVQMCEQLRAELAQANEELQKYKNERGKTYCAFCGTEFILDNDAAELVADHIERCEKHPMFYVIRELAQARQRITELESALQYGEQAVKAASEFSERNMLLRQRIAELEKQTAWNDCPECQPDRVNYYLCQVEYDGPYIEYRQILWDEEWQTPGNVIRWRPLPAGPGEVGG